MKYKKSTRIITLIIIIVFLIATFGTVVLYLTDPVDQSQQVQIQPEISVENIEVTQPEVISVDQETQVEVESE